MKKLNKVVFAGIPDGLCNLDCSYCYNKNFKGRKGEYVYPLDHMLKCFEPRRFGGPISFEGTASGETFLWPDILEFSRGMLEFGHVVLYTTNMTITPVVEKFCAFPKELRSRLVFAVSLHYLEMKRKNLLDTFFANLRKVKSAGISFTLGLVVSESYIPLLNEINALFKKEIGMLPHANMMRRFDANGAVLDRAYTEHEDKLVEQTCDARAWRLQKLLFGRKATEFCHAGEYSINLNLGTGDYTKCWGSSGAEKKWGKRLSKTNSKLLKRVLSTNRLTFRLLKEPSQIMGNLFKNPGEPIRFKPMGRCPFYDCVCAEMQCWGLIPELNVGTFSKTYLRREFVSDEIWNLMDTKLT